MARSTPRAGRAADTTRSLNSPIRARLQLRLRSERLPSPPLSHGGDNYRQRLDLIEEAYLPEPSSPQGFYSRPLWPCGAVWADGTATEKKPNIIPALGLQDPERADVRGEKTDMPLILLTVQSRRSSA